jgi:predicted molibdopterin-dependent oxidoreductase YjgC
MPRLGPHHGRIVALTVDGRPLEARTGDTVAAALIAAGRLGLRTTRRGRQPRGVFCGMGICFECVVTVNGRSGVRACVTPVADGMIVDTESA